MDYSSILDELMSMLLRDEDDQYLIERIRSLEPDFLAIRDSLTGIQRDLLDDYIGVCESQDDIRMLYAYELGRKHAAQLIPFAKV